MSDRIATGAGTLTLMGSGELAPSMAKVHRALRSRIGTPVRAVFVDTPAGFETNVDDVSARAVSYLERHLEVPCPVASYRSATLASPTDVRRALALIAAANYIVAGPGSPTYAVRQWRGSDVYAAMAQRLADGAHVVCASAAAIALGTRALPVYEIFKAGEDLHWIDGMDMLAPDGLDVAIVPHWNNAEGGVYDTRYCYMGHERFDALRALLPPSAAVLGLDEHTACVIDLAAGDCTVMGSGRVTIIRNHNRYEFESGDSFPLAALRAEAAPAPAPTTPQGGRRDQGASLQREVAAARALRGDEPLTQVAATLLGLASAIEADDADATDARAALAGLVAGWSRRLTGGEALDDVRPYIDLLVRVRRDLRDGGQWALADVIRDGLAELGVVVEDSKEATTWHASR